MLYAAIFLPWPGCWDGIHQAPIPQKGSDSTITIIGEPTLIGNIAASWIRHFTNISAWLLRTSSKLTGKKSKNQMENLEKSNS